MEVATIVPIPKVLGTRKAEEYRPINMLPVVEKNLEEIVIRQIKTFITKNDILAVEQSGFREKHSTETAVQLVVSNWMEAIDIQDMIIGAVFLDFKRAFETIDRNLLLNKLGKLGLGNKVIDWFRCYLYNRRQTVKIDNDVSGEIDVLHGVPQGSKLGPLLFILYVNDIVKIVDKCKIHLFADDTLIYILGNN